MNSSNYGISKIVDYNFEQAIVRVTQELQSEGFGVLTEIDVQQTLKIKLDADMKPYKILGACNPPFAHKALLMEEQIGLMLPCNFIVYVDEKDKTVVSAVDPVASMSAVNNPALMQIADEIRERLKRVISRI